jgi:pimeloyl-ACP methyl ester carboxylesterase
MSRYAEAKTLTVHADSGIDYAYRSVDGATAGTTRPLVLLQHFRGNLDNWDPALIDALAQTRSVITFNNAGVGASTGATPHDIASMARDAIDFLTALDLAEVDVLGYSIGSFVAQDIALTRPSLVRRLVLASAAPQGAAGMHGWAPPVIDAIGGRQPNPDGYLRVFFSPSAGSQAAGRACLTRLGERHADRDAPTTWATRLAQYDAVVDWGVPDHGRLQRLEAIAQPVFVANGDRDPMILPRYSHLLAGLLPAATLSLYSDAAHGFLFQHHEQFAADVDAFLGE